MTEVKPQYKKKVDTKKIIQNSNMERKNGNGTNETCNNYQK